MNNNWIKEVQNIRVEQTGQFAQTCEELVLETIFNKIGFQKKYVVELGAGDGKLLSNTRKLIQEIAGIKYLLVEGDKVKVESSDLKIKNEWITKDNICNILSRFKTPKTFDLLSIDLDGNDYYILQSLLEKYTPRVVICEVNGTLEPEIPVSIVYNENHTWNNDNYYGASFQAYVNLMQYFGYILVKNIAELNLIFVKKEDLTTEEIAEIQSLNIKGTKSNYHPTKEGATWQTV